MTSRIFLTVVAGLLTLGQALNAAEEGPFTIRKNGENYRVEIDGEPLPYQISGDAAGVERVIEWKLAPHPAQLAVPMR